MSKIAELMKKVDTEVSALFSELTEVASEQPIMLPELSLAEIEKVLQSEWPNQNLLIGSEDYVNLVQLLKKVGVFSQNQLEDLIRKFRAEVMAEDQKMAKEAQQSGLNVDRYRKGAFYGHVALTRRVLDLAFDESPPPWLGSSPY